MTTQKNIRISAIKENYQTKISISDTGQGILPRMRKILFNLDSQSDEVSLGSVLCAYFVEAHSGQIYIDEAQSGYTTTISFIIPPKKKQA